MALKLLFRRNTTAPLLPVPIWLCSFCSEASVFLEEEALKPPPIRSSHFSSQKRIPSLSQPSRAHPEGFNIELVDDDSWRVSSGLSEAWKKMNESTGRKSKIVEPIHECESGSSLVEDEPEFDDIEDMRFRGKLFYKLDRDSREYEECNVDYPKKKSSKKCKEEPTEKITKEKANVSSSCKEKEPLNLPKVMKNRAPPEEMDTSSVAKRERTPTFNQLTAPYHEPFCLDIFISKSSVRACIIHRVTSKVVVVAHSISKDMKFDLKSTKDDNACAAIGEILAQRALADDIHDIVYSPRKGDKVEGKLQIVLESIIDHGISVKVKIKRRKSKKLVLSPSK